METKQLIKKLDNLLKESKENKEKCFDLINQMNRRIQLINFIKTFVGFDGYIPFEHGYRPKRFYKNGMCYSFVEVYAIAYDYLVMPKKRIMLDTLTNEQLKMICHILYDYSFFCRYDA